MMIRDDARGARFIYNPAVAEKSQEFFNDYGALTNEELLLKCGFVIGENADDAFRFGINVAQMSAGARQALVKAGMLAPEQQQLELKLFAAEIPPGFSCSQS